MKEYLYMGKIQFRSRRILCRSIQKYHVIGVKLLLYIVVRIMGFSRKKNCNLPVPGGRVKVVGIPGVNQKLRKKHGFPGGVNAKKWEIPRESVEFDWKSSGVNFNKKIDILNRGDKFFL